MALPRQIDFRVTVTWTFWPGFTTGVGLLHKTVGELRGRARGHPGETPMSTERAERP